MDRNTEESSDQKVIPDDDYVRNNLEILYAVELLEYHNKNFLAMSNKTRAESKLSLLKDTLAHFKPSGDSTHY